MPRGRGSGRRPGAQGVEGLTECLEGSRLDGRTHVGHERLVVPEVVQGPEHRREHFVAAVQVAQVGAGVAAGTGGAAAALLDRTQVALVLRVADADRPGAGEVMAVARV